MDIDLDALPTLLVKVLLILGFGIVFISFPFEKISMMSKLIGMVGVGAIVYFVFKEKGKG